jgi:hypothetical protein
MAPQASGASGVQAFEGPGYLATNSSTSSGSVFRDVAVKINTGDTYCLTLQATTARAAAGGGATVALWMLGGGRTESSNMHMSNLGGGGLWRPAEVCTTATSPHTVLRAQVFSAVHGPTIGIDAAVLVHDVVKNGGFNLTAANWKVWSRTNMVEHRSSASGSIAYEGTGYLATNTTNANGGVYQDNAKSVARGATVCASARFTTVGKGSGAGGRLVVWLLGGGPSEQATAVVSHLAGNSVWTFAQACATATSAHSVVRVQYYPNVNAPTVGLDALTVD